MHDMMVFGGLSCQPMHPRPLQSMQELREENEAWRQKAAQWDAERLKLHACIDSIMCACWMPWVIHDSRRHACACFYNRVCL